MSTTASGCISSWKDELLFTSASSTSVSSSSEHSASTKLKQKFRFILTTANEVFLHYFKKSPTGRTRLSTCVSRLWCFKISDPLLFFKRIPEHYSLKFSQNTSHIVRENYGSFQEKTSSPFSRRK